MKVLDKKITIDDYFEKERVNETRNEFIAGEVYPLTLSSFIHNLIVSNLKLDIEIASIYNRIKNI